MRDFGVLIIRGTLGGLLMGHGAQKLFGWFGGYGIDGTAGWLESIGVRPSRPLAWLAGLGEFGGGLLTALGLLSPVGPLSLLGPMAVATGTVHKGKPVWVSEGGAELPVTNIAVAVGMSLIGPGRFSLDRLLGIRTPAWLVGLTALGLLVGSIVSLAEEPVAEPTEVPTDEEKREAEAEYLSGITLAEPDPL